MSFTDIGTQHASGNIVKHKPIDLMTLPVGSVVEITTSSGSMYWITITQHRRSDKNSRRSAVNPTRVYGMSVVTSSPSFGQTTTSPVDQFTDRLIRVGQRFTVGAGGSTTTVTEAKVL